MPKNINKKEKIDIQDYLANYSKDTLFIDFQAKFHNDTITIYKDSNVVFYQIAKTDYSTGLACRAEVALTNTKSIVICVNSSKLKLDLINNKGYQFSFITYNNKKDINYEFSKKPAMYD